MSDATPTYFLRDEGDDTPRGPVHLSTLQHRAALGEIDGDTPIAKSADGPWAPARQLRGLELDWQVQEEEGNKLPPCHVLALRGKVERGEVQPFWEVFHLPTGEDYQVVDALCSALLEQNRRLEDRLRNTAAPEPEADSNAIEDDANPRELRIRRDEAMHEAAKWKRLYDDEIGRNRDREEELLEQIEELRAWQRKAAERIKALERRRGQLEELMKKAPSVAEDGDRELSRAYQELQLQLEHLIDSLHLRARELEEAREENRELSLQAAHTRNDLESSLESQREIHADTLEQLSKLEQAHTDLIREYRELNHRFIQYRNRAPEPAEETDTAPEASAPSSPPSKLDMS